MFDQLITITLTGDQAAAERSRLLEHGTEVSLVCRRRNAQAVDVSRSLYFGMCDECAWVASQDLKDHDDIGIEIAFPTQAQELFASYVERVMTAKMLTNSDPLSPELFDLNPAIEEFVKGLHEEFDVVVDPWA